MGFLSLSGISFSVIIKKIKSKTSKKNSDHRRPLVLPDELCQQLSLAEIKAATNNFSQDDIIAKGDSGFIFGWWKEDQQQMFAVKRLRPTPDSRMPYLELRYGAKMLCQLRHQNVISLIGLCEEKGEMIHVYEYASNGSLYDNLHGHARPACWTDDNWHGREYCDALPWNHRLKICIGVARALHYLHTGAKFAVVHRDVNSRNILLDDQWNPKLHNFGFSKRGPFSLSYDPIDIEVESDIAYNFVCMAPEVMITSRISDKSDVYSFGVLLFEVVCCRRVFDANLNQDQQFLHIWASKCIKDGSIYDIIDPYLKGRISPECFKMFMETANGCMHLEPKERPSMGEVEVALELALELQNKADSEMESISPQGGYLYEEASFKIPFNL